MKHVKKTVLLFFLPALLSLAGCNNDDPIDLESMTEQEIQALFVGEWQEIDVINSRNPDYPIKPSVRDTTIVFFPDGTFQGVIIGGYTYYSLDREYLRMENTIDEHKARYLYSFIGKNKLTLEVDSGIMISLPMMYPLTYVYKRTK